MRLTTLVVAFVSLTVVPHAAVRGQLRQIDPPCNVTAPNGVKAGISERQPGWFGNALLSVMGLWPNGTVVFRPGGPGFVTPDDSLGMKFGWTRAARGKLSVTGHRLDGDAPPLQADIKCCFKETGFQASYLIFPTPGCWEVVAQIGETTDSRLTFVTKVVKIGEGPVRLSPTKN